MPEFITVPAGSWPARPTSRCCCCWRAASICAWLSCCTCRVRSCCFLSKSSTSAIKTLCVSAESAVKRLPVLPATLYSSTTFDCISARAASNAATRSTNVAGPPGPGEPMPPPNLLIFVMSRAEGRMQDAGVSPAGADPAQACRCCCCSPNAATPGTAEGPAAAPAAPAAAAAGPSIPRGGTPAQPKPPGADLVKRPGGY